MLEPPKKDSGSCSVVFDPLQPHGLYSPWNSPGQNTGVGSLSLLPNPGIEPRSPTLQADSLPAKPNLPNQKPRLSAHPSQGHAYVEFENPEEAAKALRHMDGGQIDGRQITARAVLAPWPQPPPRRLSPPRRMLPPPSTWRRLRRSRSRSPWGRSPERQRPRSPRRPRHWSGSSSSSFRR